MYSDYLFYDDLDDIYIKIESVDYNGEFAIIQLDNNEGTTWYPVEESLIESMEVAGYNMVSYSGDRLDIIRKVLDNNN